MSCRCLACGKQLGAAVSVMPLHAPQPILQVPTDFYLVSCLKSHKLSCISWCCPSQQQDGCMHAADDSCQLLIHAQNCTHLSHSCCRTYRQGGVMVSTDAAARGIDIPNVTHVVQADFAASAVDFLHRVSLPASVHGPIRSHAAAACSHAAALPRFICICNCCTQQNLVALLHCSVISDCVTYLWSSCGVAWSYFMRCRGSCSLEA